MKKFDSLDINFFVTYQSLLKNSPEHIGHINQLMSKYEKVVLNIFNDKLSVVKNANLLLNKKFSKSESERQVLDKEGRIFGKSLILQP